MEPVLDAWQRLKSTESFREESSARGRRPVRNCRQPYLYRHAENAVKFLLHEKQTSIYAWRLDEPENDG